MLAILFLLFSIPAWAAGTLPAVNSDMGCSLAGQAVVYNGSALVCAAPQRPTATVATLPTCNSAARGTMYIVTDALAPVALAAVAAGGVVVIGATCNGAAWIVQ